MVEKQMLKIISMVSIEISKAVPKNIIGVELKPIYFAVYSVKDGLGNELSWFSGHIKERESKKFFELASYDHDSTRIAYFKNRNKLDNEILDAFIKKY